MHPDFAKAAGLTATIISAAMEAHRDKDPGLIESIYEWCFERELEITKVPFVTQKLVTVRYKGFIREEPLRFDILVEGCVLVEVKAVAQILPIHKAQLMSYLKLLEVPLGLLINFHELKLANGINSCPEPIGSPPSQSAFAGGNGENLCYLCFLLLRKILTRAIHYSTRKYHIRNTAWLPTNLASSCGSRLT
jgi:GxxExxY protein